MQFQFQYGAIWRTIYLKAKVYFYEFQFQYGAIWSISYLIHDRSFNAFQFQYGAIWRSPPRLLLLRNTWFQFQYGAIWSSADHPKAPLFHPVSIPVWCDLESRNILAAAFGMWSFNSSMVRFGVAKSARRQICGNEFQFQYGAIWSNSPAVSA